jgi:large subunit ribosomal protein L16
MLLFPKKTKYSKNFSGKKITRSHINKIAQPLFSNFYLVANQSGIITNFQMEAVRRFLRRFLKKKAQLFFRIFPNTPITKKPNEVRLGRGKGNLKY